jgi:hypothetical protein
MKSGQVRRGKELCHGSVQTPLTRANCEKIDALKRRAQEIARDRRSRDDIQISYLEMLEERDNDNLRLAQMLAG